MSQHGHNRKQAQEDRGGAGNGFIRPLTLGFQAQMLSDVAESRFHLPTTYEKGQDFFWVERQIRGQKRFAWGSNLPRTSRIRTSRMGTAGKPK